MVARASHDSGTQLDKWQGRSYRARTAGNVVFLYAAGKELIGQEQGLSHLLLCTLRGWGLIDSVFIPDFSDSIYQAEVDGSQATSLSSFLWPCVPGRLSHGISLGCFSTCR